LKILKKLRTASFNSEFTGSYKKAYWNFETALPSNYKTNIENFNNIFNFKILFLLLFSSSDKKSAFYAQQF